VRGDRRRPVSGNVVRRRVLTDWKRGSRGRVGTSDFDGLRVENNSWVGVVNLEEVNLTLGAATYCPAKNDRASDNLYFSCPAFGSGRQMAAGDIRPWVAMAPLPLLLALAFERMYASRWTASNDNQVRISLKSNQIDTYQ